MQNVVVLSSNGFVGEALCSRLKQNKNINLIELTSQSCNLLDPMASHEAISALPDELGVVFLSTYGRFPHDDFWVYSRNMQMAHNLIGALKHKNLSFFMFTSSVCMYGRPPTQLPVSETIRIEPTGHYGLSKYASEQLFRYHFTKCPVGIFRIPGVYGKKDRLRNVVSLFADRIKNRTPIQVAEDGRSIREFLFIEDAAKVLEHFIYRPYDGILNVTSKERFSIREIAQAVGEHLDIEPTIVNVHSDEEFDLYFDLAKFDKVHPKYEPTPLRQALKTIC